MEVPAGLSPFAKQSRAEHIATVVLGVLVFAVAYLVTTIAGFGSIGTLQAGPDAFLPRLTAGTVATVSCFSFFALAFIRGYGGPVLNPVIYPIGIAAIVPTVVRWLLFGPAVDELRRRLLLPPLSVLLEMGIYVFGTLIAGISAFGVILLLWSSYVLTDEDMNRWEQTHLSEEFRSAFVDEQNETAR